MENLKSEWDDIFSGVAYTPTKNGSYRFCFITAGKWEDSYLEEIVAQSQEREKIKQKSLFV